jgi:hypothetical protein
MAAVAYGRGRLTDEDRVRIQDLADRGLSAGRIAQMIKRHQSTVYWYMISNGLSAPRPAPLKPASYVRNGRTVRHFSADEDAFILALRTQGFPFQKIAHAANTRFDTERTAHSVQVRLIMLASREDAA